MTEDRKTICAFCGNSAELKNSHIIPKFVFDWLKETSGTGYLRYASTPNKREQDGIKIPLLCEDCENMFSVWEREVAENIFKPLSKRPSIHRDYRKWLAKFSASVCWRVGIYFKLTGGYANFSDRMKESRDVALQRWKRFITDDERNPGPYELHLLPLDGIASFSGPDMPPNINRYLLRTVDIEVPSSSTMGFIYAKMCHLLLVGFIEMPSASQWCGTKIHVNRGYVGGKVNYQLPAKFLDFLNDRARIISKSMDTISEKQWGKIFETYRKDLDRAANSESIRAMNFDVDLFEQAAFENGKEVK